MNVEHTLICDFKCLYGKGIRKENYDNNHIKGYIKTDAIAKKYAIDICFKSHFPIVDNVCIESERSV